MWRSRQWRRLLNLIDHLPAASYYAEAQANDDEIARAWLASGNKASEYRPRVSTWDPIVAELHNITDWLGAVYGAVLRSGGVKPPPVKPRPRPVTAIERMERRIREEQHDRLSAFVLGRPRDPST